ncbi:hypothetical protein, partial [uncultured Duncaniella sp.]
PTTSGRMRATTEGQSSYPEARRGVNGQFSTTGIEDVRQYYPPPTIGKIFDLLKNNRGSVITTNPLLLYT